MLTIYLSLLQKVLPLFLYTVLGYVVGKRSRIQQRTLATALFYGIVPLVLFLGTLQAQLTPSLLFLPVIVFLISSLFCLLTLKWMGRKFKDGTANLLAFTAGTANSGYFGLPIALALFPPQGVAIYLFALMGMTLFESSLGFFVAALGHSSVRKSIIKVVTLPTLWTFLLAIALNGIGIGMPRSLLPIEVVVRFAYSCLGMMVVGMGLAHIKRLDFDWVYIRSAFAVRYLLWPVAIALLYVVGLFIPNFFSKEIFQSLFVIAIVPLPSNMVVIAAICDLQPEKAATAVAVSLGAGLLFVPLLASFVL